MPRRPAYRTPRAAASRTRRRGCADPTRARGRPRLRRRARRRAGEDRVTPAGRPAPRRRRTAAARPSGAACTTSRCETRYRAPRAARARRARTFARGLRAYRRASPTARLLSTGSRLDRGQLVERGRRVRTRPAAREMDVVLLHGRLDGHEDMLLQIVGRDVSEHGEYGADRDRDGAHRIDLAEIPDAQGRGR